MSSGDDSRSRDAKLWAAQACDHLADILIQAQSAHLTVVNAQNIGHGRFLSFWTVKEVHILGNSERRSFPGPAAQLIHPTSIDQHFLTELIPAESTSAAASIIILSVTVIAMLRAALGLRDGLAELCITLSFPEMVT